MLHIYILSGIVAGFAAWRSYSNGSGSTNILGKVLGPILLIAISQVAVVGLLATIPQFYLYCIAVLVFVIFFKARYITLNDLAFKNRQYTFAKLSQEHIKALRRKDIFYIRLVTVVSWIAVATMIANVIHFHDNGKVTLFSSISSFMVIEVIIEQVDGYFWTIWMILKNSKALITTLMNILIVVPSDRNADFLRYSKENFSGLLKDLSLALIETLAISTLLYELALKFIALTT